MTTPKIFEEIRKEFIKTQCEEMEDVEGRYSVYENDGDLVADWWIKKITQYHQDVMSEVVDRLEGMRKDDIMYKASTATEVREKQANKHYNQAIDDIIKSLSK